MNINYKELSRKIYLEIKTDESKWKDSDLNIITKISSLIKEEVARIKRADKYQEKIKSSTNKIVVDNPLDILTEDFKSKHINSNSIEQQIFEAQDKADTENIIIDELRKEIALLKKQKNVEVVADLGTGINRYQVKVKINSGLKTKPNFQVFKDNTEEIKDNNGVIQNIFQNYIFYIDSNEDKIRKHMVEIFESGQMNLEIIKVANNFVPPQYMSVWRNQTTI